MLLYPAIVLIAALLIIFFLGGMIIPKFEIIFADGFAKDNLPVCTLFLLEASQYARNHMVMMILLLILCLAAIKLAFTLEIFCKYFDRFVLGLPLIGNIFKKHYISQCFYTLGTLMLHNVPPLEAIQITQNISSNRTIGRAMEMIYESLEAGDSLMYPLQASHLFPAMAVSMIAIGEKTGKLAEMLLQVATIYEQDVHYRITQLMILIEPCLILLLACFVGGVVIALFLPLMTMIGSIGN
jgi:type IV pilus assembly protein PilC